MAVGRAVEFSAERVHSTPSAVRTAYEQKNRLLAMFSQMPLRQLVRALGAAVSASRLHRVGRGFESLSAHHSAELVTRGTDYFSEYRNAIFSRGTWVTVLAPLKPKANSTS